MDVNNVLIWLQNNVGIRGFGAVVQNYEFQSEYDIYKKIQCVRKFFSGIVQKFELSGMFFGPIAGGKRTKKTIEKFIIPRKYRKNSKHGRNYQMMARLLHSYFDETR